MGAKWEQLPFGFYPSPLSVLAPTSALKVVAGGNGTRTGVSGPPRAFSTVSGSGGLLTQHRTLGDSNSEGDLISQERS